MNIKPIMPTSGYSNNNCAQTQQQSKNNPAFNGSVTVRIADFRYTDDHALVLGVVRQVTNRSKEVQYHTPEEDYLLRCVTFPERFNAHIKKAIAAIKYSLEGTTRLEQDYTG